MKKIFILGAGGHTKVLIDSLRSQSNIAIVGLLDINLSMVGKAIMDVPVLGHEDDILKDYPPSTVYLVNGIGTINVATHREHIFKKFKQQGYQFLTVIHPTAYVGEDVTLGEGVQLMAGCIVQPGAKIGDNVIVNTRTSVDHDSQVGDHVHLAPGVTCCGDVTIGNGSHIGCGAVIRQGIKIGERSLVAAGAVVIKDLVMGSKVAGVPARIME